jgi:hypothetical protein
MEPAIAHAEPAAISDPTEGYAHEHRPLAGYAVLTGSFGVAMSAALFAAKRRNSFPEDLSSRDLALIGVATHKLSRLISKDKVTSFVRAPFTRYQEPAGHGEVEEKPRGRGLRLAVGELLVCPYCMGQWVAAGLTAGLILAPRPTRAVAGMYAALTISDFLQMAYKAADEKTS